jgi:hypothetical protein
MKKSLQFILVLMLLATGMKSHASEYMWLALGGTYNGLMGRGTAGDRFTHNPGFTLELGFNYSGDWQWLIYGFSAFTNKNKMYNSYEKARFLIPYYTSIRKGFRKNSRMTFLGFGIGANRMKFINTEGHDYQFMYAADLGLQLLAKKDNFIQLTLRPYGVTGNQLGYKYGTEFSLIIGFWF